MHFSRFFFERPYLASDTPVPEKSGLAYTYHVLVGLKFWLRHEMPLLSAWGISLLLCAVFAGGAFASRLSEGAWWSTPLLLAVVPFAFLGQIALTIVLLVSMKRFFDRLESIINASASWIAKIWHMLWDPMREQLRTLWAPIATWATERWQNFTNRLERIGTWLTEEPWGQTILLSCFVGVIALVAWHDPDYFMSTINEIWTEHDWYFTIMKYLFGLYAFVVALSLILALATPLIRRLRKRPE